MVLGSASASVCGAGSSLLAAGLGSVVAGLCCAGSGDGVGAWDGDDDGDGDGDGDGSPPSDGPVPAGRGGGGEAVPVGCAAGVGDVAAGAVRCGAAVVEAGGWG
ncbi:MAG TPA: hypothetical protein VNU26_03810, partial [Mycobacteriales bacterium]|nr:hypothetical protein [Mycobacteriales bacterium]